MKKLKSLIAIVDTAVGSDKTAEVAEGICSLIQNTSECCGIRCIECPFNSADNLRELAEEIEE